MCEDKRVIMVLQSIASHQCITPKVCYVTPCCLVILIRVFVLYLIMEQVKRQRISRQVIKIFVPLGSTYPVYSILVSY